MAKPSQPLPDTLILEGVQIGTGFRQDMMPGTDLAKVAKQFISEIFIAGDGVATNAKEFGVFDTYRIYDAYVTVGARGPDAVAAANAVAAFLASAH